MNLVVKGNAVFSPDRVYRYRLYRFVDMPSPGTILRTLNIIGLNPSTADEATDDPTIRRCMGFAKAWGFDVLTMTNLFAFRTTDPARLRYAAMMQPNGIVGLENDRHLIQVAEQATKIVLAWGAFGNLGGRDQQVIRMLKAVLKAAPWRYNLYCFGVTKSGAPKHPLYLPKTTLPQVFV